MEDLLNQRRKFLSTGLKLGLVVAASSLGLAKVVGRSKNGLEEGKVELMTSDGKVVEVDESEVQEITMEQDYNVREGFSDKKMVMVIDLAKCKNAKKCVSSCSKMHHVSGENAWLKVYKMQDNPNSAPYWQPTLCMHCDEPPCVKVCPVDATFKRRDGIVLIDNQRCIGCRFCMAACPYSTRVFNWSEPEKINEPGCCDYSPETGVPHEMGTVSKCDFCPDKVAKNELPDCVTACPNGVFYFGDKYEDTVTNGEETVRLSALLKEKSGYRLMEELGTAPNVYYLPPVDRLEEFEDGLENYNEFNMLPEIEEQ